MSKSCFQINNCIRNLVLCVTCVICAIFVYSTIDVKAASNYYVATTGNDNTGDGSQSNPWQTIQRAANIAQAGDTVIIRGGTYRETITPVNSGTDGAPITFTAASGESVTVSGCDIITGWTQYNGNIYQASMPWTMGKGKDQVFVDGNVLVQARYPHTNASGNAYPYSLNLSPLWPVLGDFTAVYQTSQVTSATHLNQSQNDYWKDAIFNGGQGDKWGWQSGIVDTSTNGSLTIKQKTGKWWFTKQGAGSAQGYLTDHMNCLNYAGGWQAQNNLLYLWTSDSSNPTSHTVEAKKRQLAFDLRNKNYIDITGLNIIASSITMFNANNCTIQQCKISYISHFLLWDDACTGYIDDYTNQTNNSAPQRGEVGIYIGGQNNTIEDSTISYSAGAGIYLAGLNCTITNNNIHDCGYVPTYLGCIYISFNPETGLNTSRGGHNITNNDIYNAGRGAIAFGAMSVQYPGQLTPFRACDISYNRIHDACIQAEDGGVVYSCFTSLNDGGPRTQVHHNLIYNVWGKYACGLCYADGWTYGVDYHDNVLWYEPYDRVYMQNEPDGFTGGNQPNDAVFTNNIKKTNYTGGISALTLYDYPNRTFFQTGSDHDDNGNTIASQQASVPGIIKLEAESYNNMSGIINVTDHIGGCDNNDWICFNDINLEDGYYTQLVTRVGVPDAYAGQHMEVRLDSPTGTMVGTLTVQGTGAWGTYTEQTIQLTGASGIHNIYIVFKGTTGVGSFDYFRFQTTKLEAESYNNMSGIINVTDRIGGCDNNDWVCFNNINLGNSYSQLVTNVGVLDAYAGQHMEVRLDSPTGTLVGTLTVQGTGAWNTYTEQTIQLTGATGTHAIYFVFKGTTGVGGFDYFRFQ